MAEVCRWLRCVGVIQMAEVCRWLRCVGVIQMAKGLFRWLRGYSDG